MLYHAKLDRPDRSHLPFANSFPRHFIACVIVVLLCVLANTSIAQMLVGATLHCESGECDANASDQGGDNHTVDLTEHRAEARAQGGINQGNQNGLNQDAFAEVGIRFESCISAPAILHMSDIHVRGTLEGFGGGNVIRGEVSVRILLRNITNDQQLLSEEILHEEELGVPALTVTKEIDETLEHTGEFPLVAGDVYEYVLRVEARKFGAGGWSNFQTGDRGVSFDTASVLLQPPDTDGDGLFDQWEISGIDTDCDGTAELDLPAMGADPAIKDVFLELDWMTGSEPNQAAINAVVASFAQAPPNAGGVNTPGEGINLLVDTGDLTDPNGAEDGGPPGSCSDGIDNGEGDEIDLQDADCLVGAPVFSTLAGGPGLGGGNAMPINGTSGVNVDTDDDGESDFQEIKFDPAQGAFDPVRLLAFRYGISGVQGGAPTTFGGQANGNDFIVFNRSASLLMHELGHTLGLDHGGPYDDEIASNEINCKPNYMSVMNYRLGGGIPVMGPGQDVDGDGTGDGFILDYSPPRFTNGRGSAPLPTVDETAWSEAAANRLDVSDASNLTTWTLGNQTLAPLARLDQQLNWNGDSDTGDAAPPTLDFNTSFVNPAAPEGAGNPLNSCGDGMDNDGDGLVDGNDPACQGNIRCGTAANSGATEHLGADDWSNLRLDPQGIALLDEADIPSWVDEPTGEDIEFLKKSIQTTDLAILEKRADPDPVAAGQLIVYTITVANQGPRHTTSATLVDQLSSELSFVSGEPACAETTPNRVECALGRLDVGETIDVTIRAQVDIDITCEPGEQFTTLTNSAEVMNDAGFESNPGNNTGRTESHVLCARYEYAAKYVCGKQTDSDDPRLARGHYRTTINVHNPNGEETHFFKKLALSFPPKRQAAGKIFPIAIDQLDYDEALKVDCSEARVALDPNMDQQYIEGYLVIQSPFSLDVDAVYSSEVLARDGQLLSTTLDIERVDERERKPAPRPDLVVRPALPVTIVGVPNSGFCGDNDASGGPARSVEARVQNVGLRAAGGSVLATNFEGQLVQTNVPPIPSGASVDISIDIPDGCYGPVGSSCQFDLQADAPDIIAESSENNNEAAGYCLEPAG